LTRTCERHCNLKPLSQQFIPACLQGLPDNINNANNNNNNAGKGIHSAPNGMLRLPYRPIRQLQCTEWAKKRATSLLPISSPIIDQFSKILSLAHSADNL